MEEAAMSHCRFVMIALLVLAAPAAADDWQKSYPVTARPSLRIDAHEGAVRVETWERDVIQLEVNAPGWRIASNELRILEHQTGNRIEVEIAPPHFEFHLEFTRRSVHVVARVPSGIDLEITTGDGGVVLPALSGTMQIHTGDGDITADGLKGDIRLSSGDGRIEGTRLEGSLEVHTGDGPIHMAGILTDVAASSGDGGIVLEAAPGSTLGSGWDVHTGDGDIVLRVPANTRADVDARTGDGRISCNLPVQVSGTIRHSSLRGTIGGGGPLLRIRSGDGSIRIGSR
jgi:DUF4097 and DUF4098 domain-containing protein YvlB